MKKRSLVIGGLAAATILVGGWALAQPAGHGPGGMQGMHGQMGQGMHGRAGLMPFEPARIDTLKSELGITSAQEPAWTKYAKAIRDAATAMKTTREGVDRETFGKLNPADRFAFMTKTREQAHKHFETVQAAATGLLATFDDTQKVKAREILPGLAFGPGPMHGARMGGLRHRH